MATLSSLSLDQLGHDTADHSETLDHRWHEVTEAERIPAGRLRPNPVWLRYSDAAGAITQRIVEVGALRIYGERIYLIGFCGLRADYRCFRVDRIAAIANPQTGEVIDKASWLMAASHPAAPAPAPDFRPMAPLSRATVERASAPERRGGNGGVWFAGALLGILAAAALAHRHDTIDESAVAQAPAPAPSPSWMRVGELSDGTRAQFVSVRREVVQDRSTYDAVVNQLCRDRPICVVAFFLSGEQMPLGGDSAKFTAQGGFAAYRPLAVWWSNRNTGVAGFTKWDCIRAGRAGAPPDALCGKKP